MKAVASLLLFQAIVAASPALAEERADAGVYAPAGRPWWPWLLVGTGGAALVAGGVTWGLGVADYDKVDSAIGKADYANSNIIPMTQTVADSLQRSGDSKTLAGPILVGVGAAVAVAGTVLLLVLDGGLESRPYIWGQDDSSSPIASNRSIFSPYMTADGGGVVTRFGF